MKEKSDDKHEEETVYGTPKPGGDLADKSKGKGDDAVEEAATSGRDLDERGVASQPKRAG